MRAAIHRLGRAARLPGPARPAVSWRIFVTESAAKDRHRILERYRQERPEQWSIQLGRGRLVEKEARRRLTRMNCLAVFGLDVCVRRLWPILWPSMQTGDARLVSVEVWSVGFALCSKGFFDGWSAAVLESSRVRRERDSNPRGLASQGFSRASHSAALPSLPGRPA